MIYGRGQDANRTSIKEEIKYKKTLFGLFNNNDNSTEILNKLNLLEYTETDLTKFYYAVSKTKKESSLKPIHHLTVGVGLSTFINESYGNNQYINSSVNFKTNNSLNVRIGHQLISNKKSRLVINSALEFLSINTSAIKYSNGLTNDVKYFITGNNFNFNSALNYNLIQTNSNVKIGIGVGVNLSFLTRMNDRSEEFFSGTLFTFQNFFNYKKTELHPIYCINADFKRFSLLLSYRTIRQLFNYQVGNLQKSIATLTVNYKIL